MLIKNFLLKVFVALILIGNLQNFSVATATSKIYEGVGYFPLVNESLEFSREKARLNGARDIAEQVFVDIQGKTEIKKSTLQRDEIIKKTEGLMKILEVKYKILSGEEEENSFIVQAKVTAEIDSDKLTKLLAASKK